MYLWNVAERENMTSLDDFIYYVEAERRLSPLTVRNYRADMLRFIAFVKQTPESFIAANVSPADVRGWIVELDDEGIKPQSINRMLSTLRSFYRFARKKDPAMADPTRKITGLRTEKPLPAFIGESKTDDIFQPKDDPDDACEWIVRRNRLILLFFYGCGIRLAELVGMNVEDLADGLREVKVHGKGDKERIVPLADNLRVALEAYIRQISDENICFFDEKALFLSHKGKRISRTEVYRVVRSGLAAAGVQGKRSPHVLRHTFATQMMNRGADLREIQELLGHSSLKATEVYTHNNITQLKEAYKNAHPRAKNKED